MKKNPPPGDITPAAHGGMRRGVDWIVLGLRTVQKHKPLWFGMTAIYFVLGFVLKLIPFMGDLLLVLVSPMLLAGVVYARAQENRGKQTAEADAVPPSRPGLFQAWIAEPTQELLGIFTREDKVFGAVLLGIITLGLTVMVDITNDLLVGGSMISGLAASQMIAPQTVTLVGMLVVAILYVILAMGLFYCVPLTMLGKRQPLAAIAESFFLCRDHAVALLTLTLPFFMIYLVILAAFAEQHWLGYLLVVTAGFVLLPVFIASALGSYLSLSPAPRPATRA